MPDPFAQPVRREPQGFFLSGLDWLDRLSEPIKNALVGNFAGAGRQAVDWLGDIVDAPLPGDWIDHISRPEDFVSPADALGIDREQNPFMAGATDFVGNVALNPSSYIPGTWIAKGAGKLGSVAAKGAAMLPEVAQPFVQSVKDVGAEAGHLVRRLAGAERKTPETRLMEQNAEAAAELTARSGTGALVDLFKGTTDADAIAFGQIAHNLRRDPITKRAIGLIDPSESLTMAERAQLFLRDAPAGVNPLTVQSLAERYPAIARTEWGEGVKGGVFYDGGGIKDYFPRQFGGFKEGDVIRDEIGRIKSYKGRVLDGAGSVLSEMQRNPELTLEFNAIKALSDRTRQATELAKKGSVGKDVLAAMQAGKIPIPASVLDDLVKPAETAFVPPRGTVAPGDPFKVGPDFLQDPLTGQKSFVPPVGAEGDVSLLGASDPGFHHLLAKGTQIAPAGAPAGTKQGASMLGASDPAYGHALAKGGEKAFVPPGGAAFGDPFNVTPDFLDSASGIPAGTGKAFVPDRSQGFLPADMMGGLPPKPTVTKTAPLVSEKQLAAAKDELFSTPFAYADPKKRSMIETAIKEYGKQPGRREDAEVLLDLYNGLPPRHPVANMLATAMKPFKRFAIFGAIIPKLSTDVSNAISGVASVGMNPEARRHTLKAAADFIPTVWGALNDGVEKVFGVRFGKNEFAVLDEAARQSGGDAAVMASKVQDPTLRAALQNNVFGDNFVTSEEMVKAGAGNPGFWRNVWEMPAVIFKGVEQRMRYGLFKSLTEGGKKETQDAARIVADTFYSYRVSSKENRLARDLIPFFQFTAKAVPQSAKFFGEFPVAGVALAQLAGASNDEELYPYLEGRLNLPLGKDEQGNDQYASGFRLPFESLNAIPNPSAGLREFGKQVRQQVVGAANPLLKTAFSAVSGIDPYFGTPWGSYDKIPLIGNAGAAGQAYNQLASTGLIQAAVSPLSYLNQMFDERHSLPVRALDALTGVNVVSVDPDRAIQQHLQQALESNPNAKQYRSFYSGADDDATQNVINAYEEAKRRLKAKRLDETEKAKQAAGSVQ